jgi:hypothetical protein
MSFPIAPVALAFASGLFSFGVLCPVVKSRSQQLYEKAEEEGQRFDVYRVSQELDCETFELALLPNSILAKEGLDQAEVGVSHSLNPEERRLKPIRIFEINIG